jgi:hypothetical protein
MIIDFIAQTAPSIWILFAALVIAALVVATYVDPELVEVYLGDAQFVVATLAVAAVLFALVAAAHPLNATRQVEFTARPSVATGSP